MTARRIDVALAVLALVISIYLTFEHYTSASSMLCSASGAIDCVRVTTSPYASLAGIPVALLGLVFYLGVVGLVFVRSVRLLAVVLAGGVAMVLYLIWAEIQVGAVCLWCSAVHIITLAMFVRALVSLLELTDAARGRHL